MMKKGFLWVIIGIVILGLAGVSLYFYSQYQSLSGKNADKEIKQIVEKVGKLMLLPDETPTLATVTDKGKLANQKFFRNAKNNDKVIIYSLSSKAILYRPSENKIIEVASVTMTDQGQPINITPTVVQKNQAEKIGVVIYNGTTSLGLTTKYENILTTKINGLVILDKEKASRTNYSETLVVDITGRSAQMVKEVAEALKAKVVSMPTGENPPIADILVILGSNSK